MTIKVISGNVIHAGNIIGIGGVIEGLDRTNAERLCKCGLCEIVNDADAKEENTTSAENAANAEDEMDFEEMTKTELIAYAEKHGIVINEKDKKAVIIEAIKNADVLNTELPQ